MEGPQFTSSREFCIQRFGFLEVVNGPKKNSTMNMQSVLVLVFFAHTHTHTHTHTPLPCQSYKYIHPNPVFMLALSTTTSSGIFPDIRPTHLSQQVTMNEPTGNPHDPEQGSVTSTPEGETISHPKPEQAWNSHSRPIPIPIAPEGSPYIYYTHPHIHGAEGNTGRKPPDHPELGVALAPPARLPRCGIRELIHSLVI